MLTKRELLQSSAVAAIAVAGKYNCVTEIAVREEFLVRLDQS